jgi:hypothetical protein
MVKPGPRPARRTLSPASGLIVTGGFCFRSMPVAGRGALAEAGMTNDAAGVEHAEISLAAPHPMMSRLLNPKRTREPGQCDASLRTTARSTQRHSAVSACGFAVFAPTIARLRVRDARETIGGAQAALPRTRDVINCFRFGLASRGTAMKPAPFD